jgi:hypothetical protein
MLAGTPPVVLDGRVAYDLVLVAVAVIYSRA